MKREKIDFFENYYNIGMKELVNAKMQYLMSIPFDSTWKEFLDEYFSDFGKNNDIDSLKFYSKSSTIVSTSKYSKKAVFVSPEELQQLYVKTASIVVHPGFEDYIMNFRICDNDKEYCFWATEEKAVRIIKNIRNQDFSYEKIENSILKDLNVIRNGLQQANK